MAAQPPLLNLTQPLVPVPRRPHPRPPPPIPLCRPAQRAAPPQPPRQQPRSTRHRHRRRRRLHSSPPMSAPLLVAPTMYFPLFHPLSPARTSTRAQKSLMPSWTQFRQATRLTLRVLLACSCRTRHSFSPHRVVLVGSHLSPVELVSWLSTSMPLLSKPWPGRCLTSLIFPPSASQLSRSMTTSRCLHPIMINSAVLSAVSRHSLLRVYPLLVVHWWIRRCPSSHAIYSRTSIRYTPIRTVLPFPPCLAMRLECEWICNICVSCFFVFPIQHPRVCPGGEKLCSSHSSVMTCVVMQLHCSSS